jgi:antitoxin component of MazEF toxin-antitoxin module
MKRRIIKQQTAYTLTLPIKWIRDHNIHSKDEVELEEEADSLIIHTEKRTKVEEISLTLEKSTPDYYRIMIENHYLKGYNILNIKFEDKKTFPIIQQIVSNLISFEILEQKENFCKIGSTTPSSAEQFKTLLNRCFNIITYTQEKIKEDIEKLSFKNLTEIEAQSNDARRFLLFCTRSLHEVNITTRKEESFMHLLLERLILIEHNHYHLYKKISQLKNLKIRKEVKEIYNKSTDMFNLFKEMFHKNNLKNFATINNYWDDIYFKNGHKLMNNCSEEESIIIYHAMNLSKLIFLISQPNFVMLNLE